MGQSSIPTNRLNNQWNFVDNLSGIEIYKNQNNQLAEKHVVNIDPKIDENDYITAYYQRYLPTKPIVNVFDAQFLQRSTSMCQNSAVLTVFTEYIPHRLSDVKLLNHGQGVYVLSEALAGFSELFGRVGPFQIHEDLIGFNQEGEVRVWYNPNFADNAVDNDRIILMSTINPYDFDAKFSQNQEQDMIEDTINVVARYTQFNPQFLQQVQELKKMSFSEARNILSNEIARKAYYVPDHLFLGDNNGILLKSGVELKNKHFVDPNKPKKGTKYPYFMNNTNTNQATYQQNHQQGEYADYSSDSSQSSDYHQGGYYSLNGENYRIIGTKEIQGNEINEQEILDEIVRRNNNVQAQQQQQVVYASQNPTYKHVNTKVDHGSYPVQLQQQPQTVYVNPPSQQFQKPVKEYREGHITLRESPQYLKKSNTQFSQVQSYHTIPIQPNPQTTTQQNVKVFSIDPNGRLVEERQLNQAYQPSIQPPVYQSNVRLQPQSQIQQGSIVSIGNRASVVPLSFAKKVSEQSSPTLSHRHKIFEESSPKKMIMVPQPMGQPLPQQIPQQKAF